MYVPKSGSIQCSYEEWRNTLCYIGNSKPGYKEEAKPHWVKEANLKSDGTLAQASFGL
jgi:hypothetical protein